jgi:hypothetical protein
MAIQYGTATAITITAGSLGAAANRSSAAVTTDTSKNIDHILLDVGVLTTTAAPSGNKQIIVYAYSSVDGTSYSGANGTVDDVDGTDKALTAIGAPTNLKRLGVINLNQGAVARTIHQTFEITGPLGCIPPKWGIVLFNDAGTALGTVVSAQYREAHYT